VIFFPTLYVSKVAWSLDIFRFFLITFTRSPGAISSLPSAKFVASVSDFPPIFFGRGRSLLPPPPFRTFSRDAPPPDQRALPSPVKFVPLGISSSCDATRVPLFSSLPLFLLTRTSATYPSPATFVFSVMTPSPVPGCCPPFFVSHDQFITRISLISLKRLWGPLDLLANLVRDRYPPFFCDSVAVGLTIRLLYPVRFPSAFFPLLCFFSSWS